MSLVPSASLLYIFAALAVVGLLALAFVERKKVAAWFTRVKGTQGAQKTLSDLDAIEAAAEKVWQKVEPRLKAAEDAVKAANQAAPSAAPAPSADPVPQPKAAAAPQPVPAVAADAVATAHAALDATIAHHQARVDAAKDAKAKLTTSTVMAAAEASAVADPVAPQA